MDHCAPILVYDGDSESAWPVPVGSPWVGTEGRAPLPGSGWGRKGPRSGPVRRRSRGRRGGVPAGGASGVPRRSARPSRAAGGAKHWLGRVVLFPPFGWIASGVYAVVVRYRRARFPERRTSAGWRPRSALSRGPGGGSTPSSPGGAVLALQEMAWPVRLSSERCIRCSAEWPIAHGSGICLPVTGRSPSPPTIARRPSPTSRSCASSCTSLPGRPRRPVGGTRPGWTWPWPRTGSSRRATRSAPRT